jgi:cyclophilin family peptidyl-prolyl cis-trans isomerase
LLFVAVVVVAGLSVALQAGQAAKPGAKPAAPAGPVVVVETSKGVFEFETYPEDCPKTVQQILGLVKRNFYRGQRVHRVEKNFVAQMGDPQTRDVTKMEQWGKGAGSGSGKPIGVAEFSKKHGHRKGAVGMAHSGDAAGADSQFYIMLANRPTLDGKYVVFGQVIAGMDVVEKLEVGDVLKRVTVK